LFPARTPPLIATTTVVGAIVLLWFLLADYFGLFTVRFMAIATVAVSTMLAVPAVATAAAIFRLRFLFAVQFGKTAAVHDAPTIFKIVTN
jgi:hypothetical protein